MRSPLSARMESELRATWADLPADLLATISDILQTSDHHITVLRSVCRSWRSSSTPIPNKISPLFPRLLTRPDVIPHHYLIATAVYHLRCNTNSNSNHNNDSWNIISVQEPEPGKLLLHHPLTRKPIPDSSRCRLDVTPGLTLTRISISYNLHSRYICDCRICKRIGKSKLILITKYPSMALFIDGDNLRALRLCISEPGPALNPLLYVRPRDSIHDVVSFNGHIYAVDYRGGVSLLDRTRFPVLRMIRLTCLNSPHSGSSDVGRRFVVSDGDLYLVFNTCQNRFTGFRIPREYGCDSYKVYKLVMNDVNDPTGYDLIRVKKLRGRMFYLNKDCGFSISGRHLPPPLVGNCILVANAFRYCYCTSRFFVYHLN